MVVRECVMVYRLVAQILLLDGAAIGHSEASDTG